MIDSRRRSAQVGPSSAVAGLAMLLLGTPAPAQDVVKVSPETHVVLLDNAQVRVLRVLI